MKKSTTSMSILMGLTLFCGLARAQNEASRQDAGLSVKDRRAAVLGLYELQAVALGDLFARTDDKGFRDRTDLLLTKKDPEHLLATVDGNALQELSRSSTGWRVTRSSKDFAVFLLSINQAKARYNPPFRGTLTGFWRALASSAGSTESEVARPILREAADNAIWIARNLNEVGLDGIAAEARSSFSTLFQLLADYELTSDLKILNLLAVDLKIKTTHCRATGSRADQTTQFTTDTIDEQGAKVRNWIVFAVSLTNEIKRIGDPSTPVNGQLIPGEWIFFAEKDGERSLGERHVVSQGKLDPGSILIRRRQ